MDGAREHLLAGAGLAGEQDGDRRRRDAPGDRAGARRICSEAQMLSGSPSRASAGHSAARCFSSRR